MTAVLTSQRIEIRRAVLTGDHRLAVDQERSRPDAERGINDGGAAVGPVITVAGEAASGAGRAWQQPGRRQYFTAGRRPSRPSAFDRSLPLVVVALTACKSGIRFSPDRATGFSAPRQEIDWSSGPNGVQ